MCKLRNSKFYVVLALLACLTLSLPMVATASPNNPNKPVDDSRSFESWSLCPFPIHGEIVGKTKANISNDGTRGIYVFPGEYATLTNLTNGKQVKLNITGSFRDITANGITTEYLDGRNLAWDETAGFVLIIGSWYWEYTGFFETVTPLTSRGGQQFSVCDMIAGDPGDMPPTPTPDAQPSPTPTMPPPPSPTPGP